MNKRLVRTQHGLALAVMLGAAAEASYRQIASLRTYPTQQHQPPTLWPVQTRHALCIVVGFSLLQGYTYSRGVILKVDVLKG